MVWILPWIEFLILETVSLHASAGWDQSLSRAECFAPPHIQSYYGFWMITLDHLCWEKQLWNKDDFNSINKTKWAISSAHLMGPANIHLFGKMLNLLHKTWRCWNSLARLLRWQSLKKSILWGWNDHIYIYIYIYIIRNHFMHVM